MSTHYRLSSQLDKQFDLLVQQLQRLQEQVLQENSPCWMLGTEGQEASLQRLVASLMDIWYLDGQDGRATRSYPGVVAVSESCWQQLGQVNQAKVQFSHQLELIRRECPDELPETRKRLAERHAALHAHLTNQGLARLHLKQTWRQIPGCEQALEQLGFSWYSSGRSIRRISIKEAEYRLLQMDTGSDSIQIQLKKLASLSPSEPLAQVQTQAPLMRANLFFKDPLPGQPERKAMNIALPLFLLSPEGRLPAIKQPKEKPPETRVRARRSDNKLEDEPFLPSLRVYRYSS